jgi:glycosyltransferase involved in cell wall biosynthesis
VIIGIDASSVRSGGGLSYLAGMLHAARPSEHGIDEIIVWTGSHNRAAYPDHPWLELRCEPLLDRSLPLRLFWQRFRFPELAERCDLVFVPGGTAPYDCHPLVTVSQNMLPFQPEELARYGASWIGWRLRLLRKSQGRSFAASDGVIFLSEFARATVSRQVRVPARTATIPHGVNEGFRCEPRTARRIEDCSETDPFRMLYVSIVDLYKHQWQVAEAVARLRDQGMPVAIDFVGPAYPPALPRLRETIQRLDPEGAFLRYVGPVRHDELASHYRNAELFVFASSCENLPNIVIEAMAAGLPVAAAERGPMPEVLQDAGHYFDPEDPADIQRALQTLIEAPQTRSSLAREAHQLAQSYSWKRCADETLAFLARVAREA